MLDVDSIITVTTVTSGLKGDAGTPPVSKPFPSSFSDNYESKYSESFIIKEIEILESPSKWITVIMYPLKINSLLSTETYEISCYLYHYFFKSIYFSD